MTRKSAFSVWTRKSALGVDDWSTKNGGIDPLALMETAGRAVGSTILNRFGSEYQRVVVLCGKGNNGGDGLVTARFLYENGWHVFCVLVDHGSSIDSVSPSNKKQLNSAKASGLRVSEYEQGIVADFCQEGAIIVDAVFGIGFRDQISDGPALEALTEAASARAANRSQVVAIDIPSGLNADFSHPEIEPPLKADVTITFGAHKFATILQPARKYCGNEIQVAEIGFPTPAIQFGMGLEPFSINATPASELFTQHRPWENLESNAHKFDRGHVLILGGSAGKTGALKLAAKAAMRSGCGWVTISSPTTLDPGTIPPWLVSEELFTGKTLSAEALRDFITKRHVRAVIIGPGMVDFEIPADVVKMLRHLTCDDPAKTKDKRQHGLSVVVDAGAIQNSLYESLNLAPKSQYSADRWLLTPHPGEWQRLSPENLPQPCDPSSFFTSQYFALMLKITLIHKGANPIIFGAETIHITNYGDNRLAKAGVGDVVAGAAAAHLCSGAPAWLAFARAYATVAAAAQELESSHGIHGILPDALAEIIKPDNWPRQRFQSEPHN